MKTKCILILFFTLTLSCKGFSQLADTKATFSDSLSSDSRHRLQLLVNQYIKAKILDLENEDFYHRNLLPDKQTAVNLVSLLMNQQYSQVKDLKYTISIEDDKSGKLWLITANTNADFDGIVYVAIIKNNCKVVYFKNHLNG